MHKYIGLSLLLIIISCSSQAADRYISDVLYAPVRSGQGNEYRIIHRGLRSGTKVEFISESEDKQWIEIKFNGKIGWIPSQYIVSNETAASRLPRIQEALNTANAELKSLRQQNKALSNNITQVQQQSSELNQALEETQTLAANPIQTAKRNIELNSKIVQMNVQIEQLLQENITLENDKSNSFLIRGAGIILLGMLIGWLATGRSKKSNGWG